MSDETTPTLQGVLEGAMRTALRSVRQCLPARVEAYDEAKRRITATPLILESFNDGTDTRRTERIAPITNIPVIFPGSGKSRLRWDIEVGDTVLLLFSSVSLDLWLQRGGFVDPADDRQHDINDCVALPGFLDFAHAGDADPFIEFTKNGQIHAGGDNALAMFSDADALKTWMATHTHNGVTTGGGISGTPVQPAPAIAGTQVLKGG